MAAIASILITSSCRLVPMKIISQYWTLDKANLGMLLLTTAACVFIDGAIGLLIGAMACLLRNAIQSNEGQIEFHHQDLEGTIVNTAVGVQGPWTYITTYHIESTIIDTINKADPQYVVISLEDVNQMDLDGLDSIRSIMKLRSKRRMAIVEPRQPTPDGGEEDDEDLSTLQFFYDYFVKSKIYAELNAEGLVFKDATAAANYIESLGPLGGPAGSET